MNNFLLIVKRTYQANFNKLTKIILGLIVFFFAVSIFTGTLVLEKDVFPNGIMLNISLISKNMIITLFVFFIIKKIQLDFKKGYLKNLLVNNFTKQQYYFGTILAWYFLLLLVMLTNLILVYIIWLTNLNFPQSTSTNYVLFSLFFFFIAPTAVFWFLILINYVFFVWQKGEFVIELLLLFFLIISIIWFFLFAGGIKSSNESITYWKNYFYLVFPFYNLIFSVPQDWALTHINYWWVYIIDGFYLLFLIPIFYFVLPKTKIIINGKKSTHYFS